MAPNRRPVASLVALVALNAVAALALGRVLEGWSWVLPVLGAVLGPHAISALARRQGWREIVAALVTLVAVLPYAIWVVAPATTAYGVPTGRSLTALGDLLGDGLDTLRTAVVPVPATGTALLLVVLAVWVAAWAADWSATRVEGRLGAILPAFGLLAIGAALTDTPDLPAVGLYALLASTFLALVQRDRLAERRTAIGGRGLTSSLLATGGVVAAIAVALGLVLGPAVPGGDEAVLDVKELGGGRGDGTVFTTNPLVDIRTQLREDPARELFTVTAGIASYWRTAALSDFDGRQWGVRESVESAEPVLDRADTPATSVRVEQEVRIGPGLDSSWLPAAYRPVAIDVDGVRAGASSLALFYEPGTPDGLTYRVESEVPTPTADELRGAQAASFRLADEERYLALPADFPDRVRELAGDWVAGAATPYDRALALQDRLRGPEFTYDLDVGPGTGGRDLERFLFETRRGYCEQFAGAFAAMARAVGLPARVAVGFAVGRYDDAAGAFRVSTEDAHAWPEVWLDGVGWIAFEPTPSRFEPTPGDPTGTGAERTTPAPAPAPPTPATAPTASTAPAAADAGATPEEVASTEIPEPAADGDGLDGVRVVVLVLGALALVLGAAAGVVVLAKRRRREQRRRAEGRDAVRGAWDEALDLLAAAGIRRREHLTATEFALRQAPADGVGAAGPALMDLAQRYTAAACAPEPPDPVEIAAAWCDVEHIEAALDAGVPFGTRVRRRLDPSPLRRRRPAAEPQPVGDDDGELVAAR